MRVWVVILSAAFVVGLVTAYQLIDPAPPQRIRIAAGSEGGGYYGIARALAKQIEAHGVKVDIVASHGSVDNLHLLTSERPVDFALVQGGVRNPPNQDITDLRTVATVDLEPVLLMARRELNVSSFDELAGRKVIAGETGSGTLELFSRLTELNGMARTEPILKLSNRAAATAFEQRQADVLFTVTPISSQWLREFVTANEVRLIEPTLLQAIAQHLNFLTVLQLPRGVMHVARKVPQREARILSVATNLVTRENVHPAIKMLVLQALREIDHGSRLLGTEGQFPSLKFATYPADDEAKRFFGQGLPFVRRNLPYWLANLVERFYAFLLPFLTIAIPFGRSLPGWLRRRRNEIVEHWYERLGEIERSISRTDGDMAHVQRIVERVDQLERDVEAGRAQIGTSQEYFLLRFHVDRVRRHMWRGVILGWIEALEHTASTVENELGQKAVGSESSLLNEIESELLLLRRVEHQCREADVPSEYFNDLQDVQRLLLRARERLTTPVAAADRPKFESIKLVSDR